MAILLLRLGLIRLREPLSGRHGLLSDISSLVARCYEVCEAETRSDAAEALLRT